MNSNATTILTDAPAPSVGRTTGFSGPAIRRDRRRRLDLETAGELVRLVMKDDPDAWAELVSRFTPLVRRVARRVGLSDADTADATQATWLRLSRNCHAIRNPDCISGWLARTAQRESVRVAVSSGRELPVADLVTELAERFAWSPSPEEILVHDELGDWLEAALDSLPPQSRRLIEALIDDAGLNYAEIAHRLEIPVGSIGPTRQRALAALRRLIEPGSVAVDRIGNRSGANHVA